MKSFKILMAVLSLCLLWNQNVNAQDQEVIYVRMAKESNAESSELKTYLIEREIPEAGNLTADQLKGISQKSCEVLRQMGPGIEWLHSYVTDNKVYCLYRAENEELIRGHAKAGGFPVNSIAELAVRIDPSTAE